MQRLPFQQLVASAWLPERSHAGDAGFDLRSNEEAVVDPGERAMIGTGLAVAIPEGYAGLLLPRSGLASKYGLTLANAPGLIDSGYRGEIFVAVVNLDRDEPVRISRGDRIAQLVVIGIPGFEAVFSEQLPPTSRGAGGFGSTGR
jgi:dUTP diphosphatase